MNNTNCCFNADACARRRAHGLPAWCDKSAAQTAKATPRPANVFNNYEDAAEYATAHGGRAQCTTVPGGPREFTVY